MSRCSTGLSQHERRDPAARGGKTALTVYTYNQAAAITGVARRTLERLIALGHLTQPICGTLAFKGKSCEICQNFYRSQLKAVEAVIEGKVVRNMTLGLFEMSSEITRERSYSWMAPKPTLIGVVGQPGGPSIEQSWVAKTLRHSFKQGRAWMSEPLPAIAAPPPTEAPQIPASERGTPKPDIRSGPDASKSDPPPIPPNEYDGDVGGPHSLDEVIFD